VTPAERGLITKSEFIADLRGALESGWGFAAGKLGNSECAVLQYPRVRERVRDEPRLRAFELALGHQALLHAGIFPREASFYRRWSEFFAARVASLDCVGVFAATLHESTQLLEFHAVPGKPMRFEDQEPDRSVPADEARCYLPLFRGRRLLLVCPFAELLRVRATRETFEAVWRKTGKPWFEPASVEAVEFPYGFAHATRERYATALDLLQDITCRIDARSFDVALIAAGGLGIPLASHVKRGGNVGISLGGHLQVLFGVLGRRWQERPEWHRDYFNEAWIDMPDRYKPDPAETDANYW